VNQGKQERLRRFIPYLSILLLPIGSCSDEELVVLAPEAYFPLAVGFYQVYDVERISYSAFNPPVSTTYELKQEIVDSFENGEGGTTYVMHRFIRNSSTEDWAYEETWSARTDGQYALVNEGTTTFVKLIFPLVKNTRWDGNQYSDMEEDEYVLEKVMHKFEAGPGIAFDNSLVVNQHDDVSLAQVDQRIEVYAADRGLVFKESKVWAYNCGGGTCTGQITGGFHLRQVMKAYGQD
jgi:hypothetical protein